MKGLTVDGLCSICPGIDEIDDHIFRSFQKAREDFGAELQTFGQDLRLNQNIFYRGTLHEAMHNHASKHGDFGRKLYRHLHKRGNKSGEIVLESCRRNLTNGEIRMTDQKLYVWLGPNISLKYSNGNVTTIICATIMLTLAVELLSHPMKVSVDKRKSKYGVQIQVLPSELDGRVGELVMIWGLFRSDAQSLMSLDSQSVGTSNKQSTVETVFQSKSSGKLVELDFELSLAPFYLSFFLKSELASEVNNSEIKSHRKTNFVVPIGFSSGHPAPLGLSFLSDGSVNFAVLSRSSESVVLCLYDDLRKEKPVIELDLDPYVNRSGDVWHASIDGSLPFVGYGYRCKGTTAEKTEHALNLLFDWSNDIRPNIPMEKLIVYHLNVSNFTKGKSSKLPAQVAGTFSGITEKLQHFKDLGVNAILLEPIFPFDEQKGPYFPVHFFSPGHLCGPPGDPSSIINSMKQMVKEVHANGIEVFLQVVFTHTAEGASLLHIDKSSYYYLEDDMGMKSLEIH
nr:isoamylase 2, chloroplastic [Ipomoea batatas]